MSNRLLVYIVFHMLICTFHVTVTTLCAVSVTLLQVEADKDCSYSVSNDSISATAVGFLLGGVVAGALGVLLIEGIVGGTCRLRRSKVK